jgi:hypothetical protein
VNAVLACGSCTQASLDAQAASRAAEPVADLVCA